MRENIQIVEVGPRDGFQSIGPFVPTQTKIAVIEALYNAGIRRMETTSFVSPSAVPQLADATEIVTATAQLEGLDPQVLVPTVRHAERALAAGATHLSAFLSVSERHNMNNIRRTPLESVEDYRQMVALLPKGGKMRLNLVTSFDCPYDGRVDSAAVMALLERLLAVTTDAEVALCDTTGRADPKQVRDLFNTAQERFPETRAWAFHGHDTYGMGAANVFAAFDAGVRVFDASIAGLGGCPFAPGATGNVATEDLIWMFDHMDTTSGVALADLLKAASLATALPGAQVGGRVREAMAARAKNCAVPR